MPLEDLVYRDIKGEPLSSAEGDSNIRIIAEAIEDIPSGPQGPAGAQGPQGNIGATGPSGQGVPIGGTAGQVLSKINGTNYNTAWIDMSSSSESTNVQQELIDEEFVEWNFSAGNCALLTLGGNRTLNVSSVQIGSIGVLILSQDATGGRTLDLSGYIETGFTLPTAPNAKVIICFYYDGIDFYWTKSNTMIGEEPIDEPVDLIYQQTSTITHDSTLKTWTGNNGGFGNTGLSEQFLASGEDGWIQTKFQGGEINYSAMLAFKLANTLGGYSTFSVATWPASPTTLNFIDNGSIDPFGFTAPLTTGCLMRIKRTSGVFTFELSDDDGLTWDVIKTFTYTNTGIMYIGTDIEGSKVLREPKSYGLS